MEKLCRRLNLELVKKKKFWHKGNEKLTEFLLEKEAYIYSVYLKIL